MHTESPAGEEITGCEESRTLFSATKGLRYLWMVASGMDADGIAESRKTINCIGSGKF